MTNDLKPIPMIRIYTFLLALLTTLALTAQTNPAYIRLADQTGFMPTQAQLDTLEVAAQALRAAFPDTNHRRDFAVYDFGFYLHSEQTTGGYPEAFQMAIDSVKQIRPYYLLFGRQSTVDGVNGKFWVDLKLPEDGVFACLDIKSAIYRQQLENKIGYLLDECILKPDYDKTDLTASEGKVLGDFTVLIKNEVSCCYVSNKKEASDTCASCLLSAFEELLDLNSIFEVNIVQPIIVVNDPDLTVSLASNAHNKGSPLNIEIRARDTYPVTDAQTVYQAILDQYKADIQARFGAAPTVSLHTYKYPRDCGFRDALWQSYLGDQSQFKIFACVINSADGYGYLTFTLNSNYIAPTSAAKGGSEQQIRSDELVGLRESIDEGKKSCRDLVSSSISYSGSLRAIANEGFVFKSPEKQAELLAAAARIEKEVQLQHESFKVYYLKEFELCKLAHRDTWLSTFGFHEIQAKADATWNLCSETIHTALDACGLMPLGGTVCDITNGIFYLSTGDYKNASISVIAAIPLIGELSSSVKWSAKLWKPVGGCVSQKNEEYQVSYCGLCDIAYKASGFVDWGRRGKLKELFERTVSMVGKEAHHLVPWALRTHPIMQKLAKAGWHISSTVNGKVIDAAYHFNHPQLNDGLYEVFQKLNGLITPSTDPKKIIAMMEELTRQLDSRCQWAITNAQNIPKQSKINEAFRTGFDWNKLTDNLIDIIK
jgi:hypothetical protein